MSFNSDNEVVNKPIRLDPATGYPVNVLNGDCPSHKTLALLADKWAMCVIVALARKGTLRNSQLKRAIGRISAKMLTQTLRKLEHCGIVERISYNEVPPRVEYRLTELGGSLLIPICSLADWAETHYDQVLAAQSTADDAT